MPEHQGNTDKTNNIKLTSSLDQVVWTTGAAAPGAKVGLEVYTRYVGTNSAISIQISDRSGKKFETIKSKMSGNKFWTEITVPEKAKDELFAEAKLTKHGLSGKSNPLYLFPLVKITNAKWNKNEANRGDILQLTADIQGLADGNEALIEIWEHDDDGVHDFVTKFPVTVKSNKVKTEWEFRYMNDTDDIATSEESERGYKWPEYFFRVIAAGKSAESGLLKFKDNFEIKLVDNDGNPVKDSGFKIKLADGTEKKGKLDSDGYAKIENIPPGKFEIVFEGVKGVERKQ